MRKLWRSSTGYIRKLEAYKPRSQCFLSSALQERGDERGWRLIGKICARELGTREGAGRGEGSHFQRREATNIILRHWVLHCTRYKWNTESLHVFFGVTCTWHRSSQFDGVDNKIFTNSLLERGASSDLSILCNKQKQYTLVRLQENLCFQYLPHQHKRFNYWWSYKHKLSQRIILCSDMSYKKSKFYKNVSAH